MSKLFFICALLVGMLFGVAIICDQNLYKNTPNKVSTKQIYCGTLVDIVPLNRMNSNHMLEPLSQIKTEKGIWVVEGVATSRYNKPVFVTEDNQYLKIDKEEYVIYSERNHI